MHSLHGSVMSNVKGSAKEVTRRDIRFSSPSSLVATTSITFSSGFSGTSVLNPPWASTSATTPETTTLAPGAV